MISNPPSIRRLGAWGGFFVLCLWCVGAAWALEGKDLLPAEQAFRSAARIEGDAVLLDWEIAEGYHLYRKKFKFATQTPGVQLGEPVLPEGKLKHDEIFGEMEVYRHHAQIRLPVARQEGGAQALALEMSVQGCADAGVCYPPLKRTLRLDWPAPPPLNVAAASNSVLGGALHALGLKTGSGQDELLPAEQAFRFFAEVKDDHTLWLHWQIADGYYLYREKFKLALAGTPGVTLGDYQVPPGEPKHDEEFGDVEVFHKTVAFALPLVRGAAQPLKLALKAGFQGCADRGVCYPPMNQTVELQLPAAGTVQAGAETTPAPGAAPAGECEMKSAAGFVEDAPQSEQCQIFSSLQNDSLWLTVASFLGMGLLLAFTPCVFPMIPILSGIVVGHGHHLTTRRAFFLSLSYVLASALAYAVFGVLAGLFGGNLQALFQEPRVIIAFSAVFVVLALSMFGLFTLQMPGFIQDRVVGWSNRQHGGTLAGAAVMGALSALIVGPCVAAPLAGALIYIGQSGDWVLGFCALFALGLGMGLPLLAIGASAGKLLPKAGIWMNSVKAVFGVGLLGIAVWLLARILPSAASMFLWALLLIIPAMYLGALDTLPQPASGWRRLWKGVGIVMLAYGVLLLIGVAANTGDPLQPLRGLQAVAAGGTGTAAPQSLEFRRVKSVAELDREIQKAQAAGRWAMLDYYADWCVSCKEMERYTFTDAKVRAALADVVLLQADVTDNTEDDTALLKRFGLVGPPATLFFGPDQEERKAFRVVGYMDAENFVEHVRKVVR